ncbi:hexosyltransferase [Deinococcus indicus]|uniref:glycosyltransferase n=1 Tax=Deinococcus indicus TaxID=223556 RepID=UPI001748EDE8|nr:glycosyltransferase [Deinococcus indicus]GHG27616.1 hexosyltransferase [Deinococcus indicus]
MKKAKIYFESFGHYHVDRCDAVDLLQDEILLESIAIAASESTYKWVREVESPHPNKTLFNVNRDDVSSFKICCLICADLIKSKADFVFIPGYHRVYWVVLALLAKAMSIKTILMLDSTIDDKKRSAFSEFVKSILLKSYQSAFVGGTKTIEYLKKLKFNGPIIDGFDAVDNDYFSSKRERKGSKFICISRLEEVKNVSGILDAYSIYCKGRDNPRPLHIIGDGSLRKDLELQIKSLKLDNIVIMKGKLNRTEIKEEMNDSVALILFSNSEPWGLVVNESLSAGIPVITTDRVGSSCDLVFEGLTGSVIRHNDIESLAQEISRYDEMSSAAWKYMSNQCVKTIDNYSLAKWVDKFVRICMNA